MTDQKQGAPPDPGGSSDAMSPLLLKFLTSEAIIIALATLAAYALVFCYEAGFCWYYGIPYGLISLNLRTGLGVAVILLSGFYNLIFLEFPFGKIWLLKTDADFRAWGDRFTWWSVSSIPLLLAGWNAIVTVVVSLFVYYTGTWIGRALIKRGVIELPQQPILTFDQRVFRRLPAKLHFAMSLLILCFLVAFTFGRFHASIDPKYIGSIDRNNLIMLQFYGDYVVAAPYVVQKIKFGTTGFERLRIQPGLAIFKLGESASPRLLQQNTLPLQTTRQANHPGFWGWVNAYSLY